MTLLAVLGLAVGVGGCASPDYRFVGSSDHDLVIKMPRSWQAVDTDDVLKASGVDPATRSGWMAFYDAAPRPSVQHVRTSSPTDPVLVAQSFDIDEEQRATLTDDQLRNALLPVTADARAQAGADNGFKLVSDQVVDNRSEHGVHVVFSYRIDGVAEMFDQVAVTDPKKTRGHLLVVHCRQTCFAARAGEIGDVVSSLTLKKK